MPDEEILDLHAPYPDMVIDRLRRAIVTAIDDLTAQIERVDDAFLLLSTTADMSQAVLNTKRGADTQMRLTAQQIAAAKTRIDAIKIQADTAISQYDGLQEAYAALEQRVAALESPKVTE